jgi:predicted DNA-binding transcriptional regulator AlpA
MTVTEIAQEHGVSRQTVHSYRTRGSFPKPVEGEGSTRPRFRADEVAAWFAANPPTPGKRTDLSRDEGAAMPQMTDQQTQASPLSEDARAVLMIVWKWIESANDGRSSDVGDLQRELEQAGFGPLPKASDG